jgi:hypothetical protein
MISYSGNRLTCKILEINATSLKISISTWQKPTEIKNKQPPLI